MFLCAMPTVDNNARQTLPSKIQCKLQNWMTFYQTLEYPLFDINNNIKHSHTNSLLTILQYLYFTGVWKVGQQHVWICNYVINEGNLHV